MRGGSNNWRPVQGDASGMSMEAAGDWRGQILPEARARIVNKILDTLQRHLPIYGPEGLNELRNIARRFEEKIFAAATNQSDYLRKISLKMLTMETSTQNSGVTNQMPSNPTSQNLPDSGLAEESVPTSSSSSATEAPSTESSSTAMDSHFSVSETSSHTSDGSTAPPLESAIVVPPLSIIFLSPRPLMIQALEQITEEAMTATHDAVLDVPPLDIDWPSFQPVICREVDIMSSMMFEQLREILERRPLLSLEMARMDMLARTSAYHILGYPRDPWMVSLQAVWVGLVRLHVEEQQRHWESQVLPQLKGLHAEADTVKREATFVFSAMSQAQSRMMEADKFLRVHILNVVQLRQELQNYLELIISHVAVSTTEVNRMQELQQRNIVISERLAVIGAQIAKLEQMRPGRR